eukprot:SAG22_NODE_138_length_18031_cov_5.796621_25_plen_109_part_00
MACHSCAAALPLHRRRLLLLLLTSTVPTPPRPQVDLTVTCQDGDVPGTLIERCLEGPDGQLHDWVVPDGAFPGAESAVRVLSVAKEDQAVTGDSAAAQPGTPPNKLVL